MSQVDLLDEDRPIAEQKFACLSFVSPEYLIKKKDEYFFEQFVSQYDTSKSMEKFVEFLNYISYKYAISSEEIMKEYSSFIDNFKDKLKNDVSDDYKNYVDKHEEQLELQFSREHAGDKDLWDFLNETFHSL